MPRRKVAGLRESLPKAAKRKRYCGFVFDSLRHQVLLCRVLRAECLGLLNIPR
jgi:hypothetical protein